MQSKKGYVSRRMGSIELSREIRWSMSLEDLKLLFGNFYVMNIQHEGFNHVRYFGLSEWFDEIEEGTITPEYSVVFTSERNAPTSIRFIKNDK